MMNKWEKRILPALTSPNMLLVIMAQIAMMEALYNHMLFVFPSRHRLAILLTVLAIFPLTTKFEVLVPMLLNIDIDQ